MRSRTNLLVDRHAIDLIARVVVSGQRGHGKKIDRTADSVAALMKNKLEAAGVKGARPSRRGGTLDASLQRKPTLDLLFRRVEKHLAWMVCSIDLSPMEGEIRWSQYPKIF